ncbi:hypothetical protein Tco_0158724 [Tanacetum coccineum]
MRSAVVLTTLSIAWKTLNEPLLNTHPRAPTKREVSSIPSGLSKTTLVTPIIHLGKVTQTLAGALPSDAVKNPKLGTHPVSSAHFYTTKDPQCSTHIHSSINTITIHPKQPKESQVNESDIGQEDEDSLGNTNPNPHPQPNLLASISIEHVRKLNSMLESLGLVPRSSNVKFICSKEDDGEVMFIEIIRDDEPQCEDPNEGEGATTEGPTIEYFDTFPTRDELTYHRRKLNPREDANGGVSNFTGRIKGMHIFIGNFTYIVDFMIIEDISSIIDPRLTQVVLGKHFIEISNMTHDQQEGVVRNEEDKKRGVEYVMSKILGFYKEYLELGPEYLTGVTEWKKKRKSSQNE